MMVVLHDVKISQWYVVSRINGFGNSSMEMLALQLATSLWSMNTAVLDAVLEIREEFSSI